MPFVDVTKNMARAVGYSNLRVSDTTEVATPSDSGAFRIICTPSHMANDDPIIYPNQSGASHHHTFFGNTLTNAASTNATLASTGNSTCNGGIMNRSGYWIPSLIDTSTNTPLVPLYTLIYYKTDRAAYVTMPPAGLRMIAGDAKSKVPQREGLVRFTCNDEYDSRKQHIPACATGQTMQALLNFMNCWDGKNLDSPNHKDHMAYSGSFGTANSCPTTHPVRIPDITFIVHWKVTGDATKYRLASDDYAGGAGGNSMHGDWMNGWDSAFMTTFINNCLKTNRDCHAHLLGDGRKFE
jgi:hypothetical protein